MQGIDVPVYDRNRALEQLDGDAALLAEISAVFVAECDTSCCALEAALDSGDAVELRREAHTVKSTLATFASEGGRVLASELEARAATGVLEGAPGMVAELVLEIRRLAGALETEVG